MGNVTPAGCFLFVHVFTFSCEAIKSYIFFLNAGDVNSILAFRNSLVVAYLTGAQIREIVSHSVALGFGDGSFTFFFFFDLLFEIFF